MNSLLLTSSTWEEVNAAAVTQKQCRGRTQSIRGCMPRSCGYSLLSTMSHSMSCLISIKKQKENEEWGHSCLFLIVLFLYLCIDGVEGSLNTHTHTFEEGTSRWGLSRPIGIFLSLSYSKQNLRGKKASATDFIRHRKIAYISLVYIKCVKLLVIFSFNLIKESIVWGNGRNRSIDSIWRCAMLG